MKVVIRNVEFTQEEKHVYGRYNGVDFIKIRVSRQLNLEELTGLAERKMKELENCRRFKSRWNIIDNLYSEAYYAEEKKEAIRSSIYGSASENTLRQMIKWLYEMYYNEMPFVVGSPAPECITVSQEIIDGIFGDN